MSIKETTGSVLSSRAEALVNTVNTVGVMGKGIALQFKKKFPENYREYRSLAEAGKLETGKMFVHQTGSRAPRVIINFPTKRHWRSPSKVEWVQEGLEDLRRVIESEQIRSIAIPALGCGNGGLDWTEVRPLIEGALSDLNDVEIELYAPNSSGPESSTSSNKQRSGVSGKRKRTNDGQASLF